MDRIYTLFILSLAIISYLGISPTQQPLTDSMGNILLWNGDAFYGEINGLTIPNDDCDSNFLLGLLQKTNTVQEICEILDSINGPWAIIYYNKQLNVIITGISTCNQIAIVCCKTHKYGTSNL